MNKKSIGLALFLICSLLLAAPMFADIVVSDGGTGSFISMSTVTSLASNTSTGSIFDPNTTATTGTPYWDNNSLDTPTNGVGCNIGWVVTGGSLAGCNNMVGGPLGAGDPKLSIGANGKGSYWGDSNGQYDPAFFLNNTDKADAVEFEVSLAGYASTDQFGVCTWTDKAGHNACDANPTGAAGSQLLFNGAGSSDTTSSFTVPADDKFLFYLTDASTGVTYTTDDGGIQHFALFTDKNDGATTNNFYVGAEDQGVVGVEDPPCTTLGSGQTTCSDYDYNDFVVHVSQVPEPGSLPVLVTGFAGLLLVVRRRLQAKNKK